MSHIDKSLEPEYLPVPAPNTHTLFVAQVRDKTTKYNSS